MRGEGRLKPKELTGTPGGIRTPDLLLRRQPLYPSELQAHPEESLLDGLRRVKNVYSSTGS